MAPSLSTTTTMIIKPHASTDGAATLEILIEPAQDKQDTPNTATSTSVCTTTKNNHKAPAEIVGHALLMSEGPSEAPSTMLFPRLTTPSTIEINPKGPTRTQQPSQ
jgi:hypothetical protein